MNIHAPQTLMARAESQVILNVTQNFAAPKEAAPLVVPLQDIITSTYLLTRKSLFFEYNQVVQLIGFMDDCLVKHKYQIPPPAIWKPIKLWTGKQIFSMLLRPNENGQENWPIINLEAEARNFKGKSNGLHPVMDYWDGFVVIRNSELMAGNIDKNILGSSTKGLFLRMLRDFGSPHTARCMNRLCKVSTRFLQSHGFSIGISDVRATKELKAEQDKLVQDGYRFVYLLK